MEKKEEGLALEETEEGNTSMYGRRERLLTVLHPTDGMIVGFSKPPSTCIFPTGLFCALIFSGNLSTPPSSYNPDWISILHLLSLWLKMLSCYRGGHPLVLCLDGGGILGVSLSFLTLMYYWYIILK